MATETDTVRAFEIANEITSSARIRKTGIAQRTPDYLAAKMREGKAIIATTANSETAGFCYIESWGQEQYVANSGLIVFPPFRDQGLAKKIKKAALELSLVRFPGAKLFGLTTSSAVMKINSEIGYRPVTFSDLTDDVTFWNGCQSCVNFPILQSKERKNCLCTGMLLDPSQKWAQDAMNRNAQNEN